MKEWLVGGNIGEIKGEGQKLTKVNYFKGNDSSKWRSNISAYDIVSLGEVYNGIKLKLKAYDNNVEKLFFVGPNAKPEDIKIRINGSKNLEINQKGELEVKTDIGDVTFTKPVAYQEDCGSKKYIEVAYKVTGNQYGFTVSNYDKNKEIVIDPLLASTFLGGGDRDECYSMALDGNDNVYVTGRTQSTDFPTNTGAYDTSCSGYMDVFISKFSSDLQNLLASTFLGGSESEEANSINIDESGNIFVVGDTDSSDFPVTFGAWDTTFNGNGDVFVSKLDSNLQNLLASTFIGGADYDRPAAVSFDDSSNVYVAGKTSSSDFPMPPGTYDTSYNDGGQDAFICKIDNSLQNIIACTFLGGTKKEWISSVSVNNVGVYVTGGAISSDFPLTFGTYDTTFRGTYVAFISMLDFDLTNLVYSTFLGGDGWDNSCSICIENSGNVIIGGYTSSSDFPTTIGAYDRSFNGGFRDFLYLSSLVI